MANKILLTDLLNKIVWPFLNRNKHDDINPFIYYRKTSSVDTLRLRIRHMCRWVYLSM